jgi:hypothetical protein
VSTTGPTRAIEGEHELLAWSLAERFALDQCLELGHELGVPTELEVGLDPLLEATEPKLVEPRRLVPGEHRVFEVGERLSPPECQRLPKSLRGTLRPTGRSKSSTLGRKLLEAARIHLGGRDAKPIPVALRRDGDAVVPGEELPELGDQVSHDLRRSGPAPRTVGASTSRPLPTRPERRQTCIASWHWPA